MGFWNPPNIPTDPIQPIDLYAGITEGFFRQLRHVIMRPVEPTPEYNIAISSPGVTWSYTHALIDVNKPNGPQYHMARMMQAAPIMYAPKQTSPGILRATAPYSDRAPMGVYGSLRSPGINELSK